MATRRSGNYRPSIWDNEFLQSLTSVYLDETYVQKANVLKRDVKTLLKETSDPFEVYELVDVLQRLGISYHFEDEINEILGSIHKKHHEHKKEDLHSTALEFRILRQHSYFIPHEIFTIFMDEAGNFKKNLSEDINGIMSLYEASYLCMEGENMLDVARNFTTQCLKEYLKSNSEDQILAMQVSHALELPFHWRVPRLEARWFIDMYERKREKNSILLELAKLDFNMVQAMYQEELKQISKWYESTCLSKKLSFARDRMVEGFLWTIGFTFEPQYEYCRRILEKVGILLTVIDDIYDVYGTLNELELFTDVVERWDINTLDKLPGYMKIAFLVLFNSINEMGYDVLKEHGFNVIPYLGKTWVNQCKSYLVDAKWYYSGYTPTLSEYLDNGFISSTGPLLLLHAYFCMAKSITKEALEGFHKYPDLIRGSSLILRMADDLGTSSDELKRGDVPKSIQCYMNDAGVTEMEARDHIMYLISEHWKKMNKALFEDCHVSESFIKTAMSLARIAQCFYQFGDGHGIPDGETKNRILSLIIDAVPLSEPKPNISS